MCIVCAAANTPGRRGPRKPSLRRPCKATVLARPTMLPGQGFRLTVTCRPPRITASRRHTAPALQAETSPGTLQGLAPGRSEPYSGFSSLTGRAGAVGGCNSSIFLHQSKLHENFPREVSGSQRQCLQHSNHLVILHFLLINIFYLFIILFPWI